MKATMQKVPQRVGWSWRYKMFEEVTKPEYWHAHQEFELVLHRNFQGKSRGRAILKVRLSTTNCF
ncbi:hypothetical protein VINI7043_22178 [Vibrio nigripulchritudo ATCC 27043]|nr:hypothetical protein VINI7043_22178 [Vibrio nigripulchritudo ATCC 27043]